MRLPPIAFVAECPRLADQMLPVFVRSQPKMMESMMALTVKTSIPRIGWSGKVVASQV